MVKEADVKHGPCHFCRKPCVEAEFCVTCEAFICDGCMKCGAGEGHKPEDHCEKSGNDH